MAADLHIYVPDDLKEAVKEQDLPVSQIAQKALYRELAKRQIAEASPEEMEIELWTQREVPYAATFRGVWLVEPHPDETRAEEEGYDAGAYWGIALIDGGEFLVYLAHCTDGWAPEYTIVNDLIDENLPANIYVEAALEFNALLQRQDTDAVAARAEPYEVRRPLAR